MHRSSPLLDHFHPVLLAARLKKAPVRVRVAGRPYVLFRDANGRPAALDDRCPHRFAPLSAGAVSREGRLTCAYHGWSFDADGAGRSPSQPTLKSCNVEAFQLLEQHGYLWLANRHVLPSAMPKIGGDGLSFAGSFSLLIQAPLHAVLDAFSEAEHTPFVHERLGWDPTALGALAFESKNFDDRTEVRYAAPQRTSLASRLLGLKRGDIFETRMTTRFSPVHNVHSFRWTDAAKGTPRPFASTTAMFYVPETSREVRVHVFVFVNIQDARVRWLLPLVKPVAMFAARRELKDDQAMLAHFADAPFEMKGMRLGRFDAPLVHHRKLLKKIYFGESEETRRALHVLTPSEKLRIAG
jgi:phenylpropionate dioxygenase-like ring-hydroxylating dioxygenase large terminal subunit